MNINKVIATAIFLVTFLVPFYLLFIVDEGVTGFGHILLFLLCLAGFFTGFAIGTNEPFGRKRGQPSPRENRDQEHSHREAA
ncbi:MAG: hypothetical protein FD123_763 [Bacteroidetes bacterium]|nr:MAG: hypothetical protein FD123_763 [Bacteroidota bacterium]